jgi:hypothetical protein
MIGPLDVLDPVESADEQLQQRGSLVGVKGLEDLVLDGVHGATGAIQRLPAGLGDQHAVTAAILGITAADEMAAVLELVEEEDDVLGVHAQRVDQLLLGRPVVIT